MDIVTPQERSRIMSRVKSRGNQSTELKLLELFSLYKLKGWRRKYLIKGSPDFVFLKRRLAIFVDGCFWHGCPKHCRIPKSNEEYWVTKINQNKKRDYKVTKELRGKNWTVIRLWEHELKDNQFKRKMNKIKRVIHSSHSG
jgi:DNA mismatch endonuclease, patch repair protein